MATTTNYNVTNGVKVWYSLIITTCDFLTRKERVERKMFSTREKADRARQDLEDAYKILMRYNSISFYCITISEV